MFITRDIKIVLRFGNIKIAYAILFNSFSISQIKLLTSIIIFSKAIFPNEN
jgi:hypothetical protein